MKKQTLLLLVLLLALTALFYTQCTEKYPDATKTVKVAGKDGCTTCHLDAEKLKMVATPLPPSEGDTGEG